MIKAYLGSKYFKYFGYTGPIFIFAIIFSFIVSYLNVKNKYKKENENVKKKQITNLGK